jgi:DedD protein
MAEGKKTYYQVSFTGGQALAAVISVILALGLAFFFGAKAGFERAPETEGVAATRPVPVAPAPASGETTASAGTVPPGTSSASSSSSPASTSGAAGAIEEAPVFEDREAGPAQAPRSPTIGPAPSTGPSRTEIAGGSGTPIPRAAAAPPPAASGSKTEAPKKPPSEQSDRSPAKAAPGKGGYYVQVLSTSSKAEAGRWKEKLAAKSYRSAAVTSVDSKKGKLYRVRTGPYADKTQAKKAAAKISADFKQKAWVAPE